MLLELHWGDETARLDLVDGVVRVGGGPDDDIRVAGLPGGLLTLRLEGARVTATSTRSLQIGAALFPPCVPRMVVEGEEIRLATGVRLRRPIDPGRAKRRQEIGTAVVARELLSGGLAPTQTRAATLTCVTGVEAGMSFPIAFADCTIGRAEDADVRILDRAVSRRHARLLRRGQGWCIEDRATTNGVYVNGVRVTRRTPLETGDVIELGHTLLRFEGPELADPPRSEPPPAPPRAKPAEDPVEGSRVTATERLPGRRPSRRHGELALIAVGAACAIAGAALTWALAT